MYAASKSIIAKYHAIRTQLVLCVVIAASLWATGCKTLSLPAIDPTGNRIFNGQWTPVIGPHDPNNGYPSTAPAYQTPPEPPPCMQGADGKKGKLCQGCLSGKGCLARKKEAEDFRGRCGQLLLTPTRIVAPVGGEVILLAGICGKDEILVTNEPIEWMLAPNSVGEIVAVGDDTKGEAKSFWKRDDRPKVEKLGVDFARGRTSAQAGVITRGTSSTADDLPVRKGQTWVSLTSPTEGTSKVTALAPDSDVWDQRRQTATIYWIDASWQLPGPTSARSGEEVQLITRVMRSEGFAPAEGWIVRYRSLNPDYARFVPGGVDQVSVNVDANGVAAARIVNGSANAAASSPFGNALVEVEIIKPSRGSENMPELQIARGTTMVTWSAPSLVLDAVGPEVAVPGQDLPYNISVANVGDVVSESTFVNVKIPSGMQFRSSSYPPDSQSTNDTLRWTIGALQPRVRFDVTLNLVATAELDGRIQVDAIGAPNLRQQKIIQTFVQKPTIALQFAPKQGMNQVEVGSEAAFDVVLTNSGSQTINNLDIILSSDTGLTHIRGGNQSVQTLAYLTPGQSRPLDAVFVAQREGPLCATATVQSAGQILATQKACIQAIPAAPKRPSMKLQLENVSKNAAIAVGDPLELTWSIVNNGQTTLRSPIVTMQVDPALEVGGISRDYEQVERGLYRWRLSDMQPGVRVQLSAAMRGLTDSQRANVAVRTDTADGVSDSFTFSIGIGPNGLPPAVSSGTPPGTNTGNPIRSGFGTIRSPSDADEPLNRQLSVLIAPSSNNVKRGEIGTYEIRVENLSSKPQQQVTLNLHIPQTGTLAAIRAKELRYRLTNNDKRIEFEPIKYLRGNEVFSCTIQLRWEGDEESELLASVSSMSQTEPSLNRLTIRPSR